MSDSCICINSSIVENKDSNDNVDINKPLESTKGKRVLKNLQEGNEHIFQQWKENWSIMSKELSKPSNISPGQLFCTKCDPNARDSDPKHILKTIRMLEKQVSFKKYENEDKGTFVYHRHYKSEYTKLPLGYNNCKAWHDKLNAKLKKLKNSNDELNYRLNDDYINGRIEWYDSFIARTGLNFKPERQTFLPALIVHNAKSTSSPLRIVQTPNIPFPVSIPNSKISKLTYNECITDLHPKLPAINLIYILYQINITINISDVKDFFKNVELSDETAGSCLQIAYKRNDGSPSLCDTDCTDKSIHTIVWKNQSYGTKDAPAIASFALQQCVAAYSSRTLENNKIDPLILKEVKTSVSQLTYVDDQQHSANSNQIQNFFLQLSAFGKKDTHFKLELGENSEYQPTFTRYDPTKTGISNMFDIAKKYRQPGCKKISAQNDATYYEMTNDMSIDKHGDFILELSIHHSLIIGLCLQKVINYGNFYLKEFHSTQPFVAKILNKSLVKRKDLKPDNVKYKRPPAHVIHDEFNRFKKVNQSLNKIDEEISNEPKLNIMTQLGKEFIHKAEKPELHPLYTSLKYKDVNKGKFGFTKIKNTSLLLYEQSHAKGKVIKCTDYSTFMEITSKTGYVFTQRSLLKLVMSLFDPSNTKLFLSNLIAKRIWQELVRTRMEASNWDKSLDPSFTTYMQYVAYTFFNVSQKLQPRLNLILHPSAVKYLIGLSDAGKDIYCNHVIMLTQVIDHQGVVIAGGYELLSIKMHVKKLNYTMPENELLGLYNCLNTMFHIKEYLAEQSINFHKDNIIACCDSTTSLIQIRTERIDYNIRVGALCNKVKAQLIALGINPFTNCFWYNQKVTPFPVDLTSKFDFNESINPKKLEDIQNGVEFYPKELVMIPPTKWEACNYDIAIPSLEKLGIKDQQNIIHPEDIERASAPTIYKFENYEKGVFPTLIDDVTAEKEDFDKSLGDIQKTLFAYNTNIKRKKKVRFKDMTESTVSSDNDNEHLKQYVETTIVNQPKKFKEKMSFLLFAAFKWLVILKRKRKPIYTTGQWPGDERKIKGINGRLIGPNNGSKIDDTLLAFAVTTEEKEKAVIVDTKPKISQSLFSPGFDVPSVPITRETKVICCDNLTVTQLQPTGADSIKGTLYITNMIYTHRNTLLNHIDQHPLNFEDISNRLYDYMEYIILSLTQDSGCSQKFLKSLSKDFRIYEVEMGNIKAITLALSRAQRVIDHKGKLNGPFYVILKPINCSNEFGNLMLQQEHNRAHLRSSAQTKQAMVTSGYCPENWVIELNRIKHTCTKCAQEKIRSNQERYNNYNSTYGSNLDSSTKYTSKRCAVTDLLGPYFIKSPTGRAKIKVWFCLFLDMSSRKLSIEVLDSVSAEKFLLCFLRHSSNNGWKRVLFSDAGSIYWQHQTSLFQDHPSTLPNLNELEKEEAKDEKEKITKFWHELINTPTFKNKDIDIEFYQAGSGDHQAVGGVELMVGQVKLALKRSNLIYYLKNGSLDWFEVSTIIKEIEAVINHRLLGMVKGVPVYPDIGNDLITERLHQVYSPYKAIAETGSTFPSVLKVAQIIAELYEDLKLAATYSFVKDKRIGNKEAQFAGCGENIEYLKVGDLVYDQKTYQETGRVTSSLYRIGLVLPNKQTVIIHKPAAKYLNQSKKEVIQLANDKHYKAAIRSPTVVSRSSKDIISLGNIEGFSEEHYFFEKPNEIKIKDIHNHSKVVVPKSWSGDPSGVDILSYTGAIDKRMADEINQQSIWTKNRQPDNDHNEDDWEPVEIQEFDNHALEDQAPSGAVFYRNPPLIPDRSEMPTENLDLITAPEPDLDEDSEFNKAMKRGEFLESSNRKRRKPDRYAP